MGRDRAQRRALLSGLAASLFLHKRIQTTLAKAKEVQRFTEKLITKAKKKSPANIRSVSKVLPRGASKELFDVIAPKSLGRLGGYTRIMKVGQRRSDAAPMAYLELVDFPNEEVGKKEVKKDKKEEEKEKEKEAKPAEKVEAKASVKKD